MRASHARKTCLTVGCFPHVFAVLRIFRWIFWLAGHSSPLSVLFEVAGVAEYGRRARKGRTGEASRLQLARYFDAHRGDGAPRHHQAEQPMAFDTFVLKAGGAVCGALGGAKS